ncbi:MAG: PA14 domain-containing protein, partial [Solirubrobacterales bacterium]
LWLSTNEDPANATMIAQVASWTGVAEWTKEAGQKSAPVSLVAGQKYYLEGLLKEGGGGDSLDVGWAGPGIGDAPVVLAGQYCVALVRDPEPLLLAHDPKPASGAIDVLGPTFEWAAGVAAVSHDIYFGTTPELGEADFKANWPVAMYYNMDELTPGATYYWRVDEVDAAGGKTTGTVWSFMVTPLEAHTPSPYDGALWRGTNLTVSWTPGQNAVSHKVYGGTDQALVADGNEAVLLATIPVPSIDASPILQPATTYFWRVDEIDAAGNVTPGPVWTFTTFDPEGGAVAEYWSNKALTGEPNVVTTVGEVNFNWPNAVPGVDSPDVNIPVDNFSCRWTAALNVPVTGTYKLYDASDDGARLFLNGVQITNGWVDRGTTEDASADLELVAGQRYVLVMEMYESGGGASAYLRWSGPDIPKEIIPQGALQFVTWAYDPQPVVGTEGLGDSPVLSWLPGVGAVSHNVYLSSDQGKVAAGDASVLVSQQAETSFASAPLGWNKTYYWRVDEVAEDGSVVAGEVWSFAVADYIPVIDDAVTVAFDNTADPFITELAQEYAGPQDWTKNGVTSLQLDLRGGAKKFAIDGETYSLMAAGADIWGNADEFRYAYKALNGDGTMIARVASRGTGSNEWAKGGVMIRQSTAAGSTHAFMPITGGGGNGASFQGRLAADGSSSNADSGSPITPPYYVKIERVGSTFNGFISADANEWTQLGTWTIEMADPVCIGLAVTSHASGELRTFQFDNVSMTGDVAGDWAVADIGVAQGGNDPAPVYVALTDAAGNTAVVTHPDNPNVAVDAEWRTWKVLLSSFAGVDLKNITNVAVGIGDGQAGGAGQIQVANVRVVKPITVTVVNPSFEQPNGTQSAKFLVGVPVSLDFSIVPGWSTDSACTWSSIRKDIPATSGNWAALVFGGEPSIWQVTDHVIVEGESFTVDVDALVAVGSVRDNKGSLKISLFYDNDGARVAVATKTWSVPYSAKKYSVSFSTSDARAAVGHAIGIEIANVSDNGLSVDNIRLKTK